MIQLDLADLGRRAEAMILELGRISAEPDRLVRLYLSPEHRRAIDLVAGWMRDVGLDITEDAAGTLCGRLEGPPDVPRLLLGSHLDTVIDAGKYDGALGIISALLAIEQLKASGEPLPFGIDILAFGEEEGSRFPTALFTSSVLAGRFDPADLDKRDSAGIRLGDALRAFGKNPDEIPNAARKPEDTLAYMELHIEQGPNLEHEGLPVGIVSGIAGMSRTRVVVRGTAGHAGTVPMTLRSDALLAAAEMVLAAERIARAGSNHAMVGTVGILKVSPGAANVIPSEASFSLDLRAATDDPRRAALARFVEEIKAIATARSCSVDIETFHEIPATPCSPKLQKTLAIALDNLELPGRLLSSGAGHDGQAMAKLTDIGMLFIRCRDGISHNPAEFVEPADMALGVAAIVRFCEALQRDFPQRPTEDPEPPAHRSTP